MAKNDFSQIDPNTMATRRQIGAAANAMARRHPEGYKMTKPFYAVICQVHGGNPDLVTHGDIQKIFKSVNEEEKIPSVYLKALRPKEEKDKDAEEKPAVKAKVSKKKVEKKAPAKLTKEQVLALLAQIEEEEQEEQEEEAPVVADSSTSTFDKDIPF